MKNILFLCTGNYYRSRFSEELFNHLAKKQKIDWHADSKGLVQDMNELRNVGPISIHAMQRLIDMGIKEADFKRMPEPVTEQDWDKADKVIAVYGKEHLPLIRSYWPEKETITEFWDAPDVHEIDPEITLNNLESRVKHLIHHLKMEKKENPDRRHKETH